MDKMPPKPKKQRPEELPIDTLRIKKAAGLLRAVNHPFRQQVLRLIQQEGSIGVTALYQRLKIIQPVASTHLATLRKVGVVSTRRDGKRVLYSINHEQLEHLDRCMKRLLKKP